MLAFSNIVESTADELLFIHRRRGGGGQLTRRMIVCDIKEITVLQALVEIIIS